MLTERMSASCLPPAACRLPAACLPVSCCLPPACLLLLPACLPACHLPTCLPAFLQPATCLLPPACLPPACSHLPACLLPVQALEFLPRARQVAVGWRHCASISEDNRLRTWGFNGAEGASSWALDAGSGQLGVGDDRDHWAPTQVQRLMTSEHKFYDLRMSYIKKWKAIQVGRQAGREGGRERGILNPAPRALNPAPRALNPAHGLQGMPGRQGAGCREGGGLNP